MAKRVAAIICAAGSSSRFGGKRKKPFVDVGGRAAFLRSVELFTDHPDIEQTLLSVPQEDEELIKIKWGDSLSFFGVKICYGGSTRTETVKKALSLIREDIDLVAVHDAARCCITAELLDAVIRDAAQYGAAAPGYPVISTLKQVRDHKIVKTIDRDGLYEIQTPQIFTLSLIQKAYHDIDPSDTSYTDDAQLVEALGHPVHVTESTSTNIKLTTPADVPIAEAILKYRQKDKPKGPLGPYNEAQW